jgi:hypothetical protein
MAQESYKAVLRQQPTLESKTKQFHIWFDLVARFPQWTVMGVILGVFGQIDSRDAPVWNSRIFLMPTFKGLRIRRAYIPPTKEQNKFGARGVDLRDEFARGQLDRGKVFQILEIKWLHEVERVEGGGDLPRLMSVHEYFDLCK